MAKDTGHAWYHHNRVGRQVCDKCGLILLRNTATRKAANKACPGKEDDSQI